MSALAKVKGIKESLSKQLPEPDDVEACRDMLTQLDRCDITLAILTETLIGTVVSKFKAHEALGPTAKGLVKKWKRVAKSAAAAGGKPPVAAAAAKKKKAPPARRESATEAVDDEREEWNGLQPYRKNACQKLRAALADCKTNLVEEQGINAEAVEHLLTTRATEIEASMQKTFGQDKTGYAGKARSLCFNLKQNHVLGGNVVLGHLEAGELVGLTPEQLASDEQKQQMQARAKKIMDTNRLDWDQANESKINEMCGIKGDLLNASLFTCGRCKSVKTTSTQKQTRSADEPMTVFVLCLNCGKRWKC